MINYTVRQSGMTLVEMLMAIGVFAILMLAVFGAVSSLYSTNSYAIEQGAEVDNARRGVDQWNKDAKEMTTAEDGTWPLVVIEPYRLGYYSDTDQDDSVEYVEYILIDTTLYKYTYEPDMSGGYDLTVPDKTETLSKFVQNNLQARPTFKYFDATGTELTVSSPIIQVRYLQMELIVNIDPNRNPGEFMLRSSLAPRNLKDNL